MHPTQGKLHCYLIVFLGHVSVHWFFLRLQADLFHEEVSILLG
jgi:hypothetical protein